MERTRRDSVCFNTSHDCESTLTRFVWAGDQLLWELRVPGGNEVVSSGLESTSASGDMYGRVSYFHAGGIDKPLLITKEGVESVVPRETWRGQFHKGTSPATGLVRDCPIGVQTGCLLIAWPGMQTNAAHSWGGEQPDIRVWYGGLVDGMRDASGQMYMRNRYYDPATGQFTQTDPIGLAGGLNAYGFANGDPVSYSDPYGLTASQCCPFEIPEGAIRLTVAHFTRNAHNTPLPATRAEADQKGSGFEPRPEAENAFHRYGEGAEGHVKYTAADGREAIYDSHGQLVTDPTNAGTFNYDPGVGLGHVFKDVLPYIVAGNGTGDRTTFSQRLETTFQALDPPTDRPSYSAAKCAPHCE